LRRTTRPATAASAGTATLFAAFVALALAAAAPDARADSGPASSDPVPFAENLVRQVYFERLPFAEAQRLEPAGIARLIEMLASNDEAEHWTNIVIALGISGAPNAYDAMVALESRAPHAEIGRAESSALRAIPLALGHLARSDRRALLDLIERTGRTTAPRWTYRHLAGARLTRVLQRGAVSGLAVSGLPEADAALARLEEDRARSLGASDSNAYVREMREFGQRVQRDGAAQVFGGEPRPDAHDPESPQ